MGNDPKTPAAPAAPAEPAAYKPPASEAEEHERFGKFLNKFLEEDDTPTATPASGGSNGTPASGTGGSPGASSGGSFDIESAINRALDARDGKKTNDGKLAEIEAQVKKLSEPRKPKWWQPFTPFADR